MILLNLNKPAPALVCPHCERPMDEHDGADCRRSKVSRRFFLGGLGMAAAGTVAGLAFAKQASAALEDITTAPVLTEKGEEALVVQAAPKVHRGGAIILTYQGNHSQMQIDRPQLQQIADREGRMVIFRNNGEVRTASPTGAAFENKWERPSLARAPK